MSWRTRKRGTPRQIGKVFPILQKKRLPKRISLKKSKRMCPTLQRLAGEGRSDYNDWLVQQHIEQWHDANGVCLVGIPRFQYDRTVGSRRLVYEKVATDYPSKLAEESLLEKVLGRGGKVSPEETRYRFYEYLKRKGFSEMEIADILAANKSGGKFPARRLKAAINKRLQKSEILYYMAKSSKEAGKKAREENPNMVVVSTKIKAHWPEGVKEYQVILRKKSR